MESGSNYPRSAESTLAQVNSSIESLATAQNPTEEQQIFRNAEEILQAMQTADVAGHEAAIQDAWRRLKAAHNQAQARIGQST